MKPVSLTEAESVVIGVKFNYLPPESWQEEYSSNWRYLDRNVAADDLPILKSLEEKRLVYHMNYKDWPVLVNEDCWVLTDGGLGIFNWFHSFPENYGL